MILINNLLQYRVYPKQLREYIVKHFNNVISPVYLGDVN